MAFPFSLRCECCGRCRPCPCASGTAPAALVFEFTDWGSYPSGYCHRCDELNGTFAAPQTSDFAIGTEIGDDYDLYGETAECVAAAGGAGFGCRYEADHEFDCVPQPCLEECASGCGRSCTADGDCEPAACGDDYSCGAYDPTCGAYGGPCAVVCAQDSVCVFDEEFDPEHEHGVCTPVGACAADVTPGTCAPIKLRLRAALYVDALGRGVLSAQVLLFCRTTLGEPTAVQLVGRHTFTAARFDCGELDLEIPLEPATGYVQPIVPACGPATTLRIAILS